jgi:hypothetical protein
MSTAVGRVCPRCEAKIPHDAARCWLCGMSLPVERVASASRDRTPEFVDEIEVVPDSAATFTLTSLFLLMTLIAVGMGLFVIAPGLGILLGMAAAPALIRTALVAHRRDQLGRETSPARKIALFVASVAVTVLMGIVVIVGAIGSFCIVCLTAGTEAAIPVAGIIGIAVATGVVALFAVLIRARYRRDVDAR